MSCPRTVRPECPRCLPRRAPATPDLYACEERTRVVLLPRVPAPPICSSSRHGNTPGGKGTGLDPTGARRLSCLLVVRVADPRRQGVVGEAHRIQEPCHDPTRHVGVVRDPMPLAELPCPSKSLTRWARMWHTPSLVWATFLTRGRG
jgi:hypothetical protein